MSYDYFCYIGYTVADYFCLVSYISSEGHFLEVYLDCPVTVLFKELVRCGVL